MRKKELKALTEVIDYLIYDEEIDYEASGKKEKESHIYNSIIVLKRLLQEELKCKKKIK